MMPAKHIQSRDNPGFKQLLALYTQTREQRRQGLALLDGIHLITSYRDKIGLPRQLVVAESALEHAEIKPLCASLKAVDTWVVKDSLLRQLSETRQPAGILALIDIPQPSAHIATPTQSVVVLDAIQDAGNVGTLLRSAAAAGIRHAVLGQGCAGAWSARVLRAAQGAHFDLCLAEQVDLLAWLQDYPGFSVAASAHATTSLYALDLRRPIAWVFGNEGQGIAPALEALVRQRIRIPLAPGAESLNVAAAAAVCLFEQVRQLQL